MGAAHCLELTNSTYSDLVLRLQTLCDAAKAPPKSTKGTLVDCTDKRFDFPKVSIALLIKWSKMGLGSVKGTRAHESFRIKPYCEKALNHAGAAH